MQHWPIKVSLFINYFVFAILLNSVGTVILDPNQRIAYISAIGRELLGFDDEDVVGRRWSEVMPLSEVSSRRLKNAIALPLASRPRLELNWPTGDRREVWVDCDVQDDPRDEKGRILYLYDRSEVHSLRDTLGKVRYGQMLGESRAMLQLFQSIEKVAAGDWTFEFTPEGSAAAGAIYAGSPLSQDGCAVTFVHTFSGLDTVLEGEVDADGNWDATVSLRMGSHSAQAGSVSGRFSDGSFSGTGSLDLGGGSVDGTWTGTRN